MSPAKIESAADRKRSQIVRGAASLFESLGYHQTSMGNIAEACNLAKPTLYHYFVSKAAILYDIHEEFMAVLFRALSAPERQSLPAAAQIRFHMQDMLSLNETHPGYVRVFFEHFRELDGPEKIDVQKKRDQMFAHMVSLLETGVAEKDLRPGLDPEITAMQIYGMCNWAYQWFTPEGRLSAHDVANQFWYQLHLGIGFGATAQPFAEAAARVETQSEAVESSGGNGR